MAALPVAASYTPAAAVAHKPAAIMPREAQADASRDVVVDELAELTKELRDILKISQDQVAENRVQEATLVGRLQRQADREAAEARERNAALGALREQLRTFRTTHERAIGYLRSDLSHGPYPKPVCGHCIKYLYG